MGRAALLAAIATVGFAISGCGGSGGSSGAAAIAQSPQTSIPAQSSTPAQGSTTAQNPTAAQSESANSGTTDSSGSGSDSNLPTPSTGSVTINWMPPTENTDGSTLTNLAGYRIHYGTASGRYTQTISVSNAGLATYVVSDLAPGRYYFVVAAVNGVGTESPLSSEVTATVD